MSRVFIILAALLALIAVAAGAFGAHALRDTATPQQMEIWKTAATYQMWHALGLLLIASLLTHTLANRAWVVAGWLFITGAIVFSGSLYVLVLSGQTWLGAITPFGGIAFMAGWVAVALGAITHKRL